MIQPRIFEGTAEEIAEQLRESNLTGRLKAIVTPEFPAQNGNEPSLADALSDFLSEVDQIEFTPGKPLPNPREAEIGRLFAKKFASQGHTK